MIFVVAGAVRDVAETEEIPGAFYGVPFPPHGALKNNTSKFVNPLLIKVV